MAAVINQPSTLGVERAGFGVPATATAPVTTTPGTYTTAIGQQTQFMGTIVPQQTAAAMAPVKTKLKYGTFGTEPVRATIWIVMGGWLMALAFLVTGVALFIPIVTLPWGLELIKWARFYFNPITGNKLAPVRGSTYYQTRPWYENFANNPLSPWMWIGTALWWIGPAWALTLGSIGLAILNAITIIGLPNAALHLKYIPNHWTPFNHEFINLYTSILPGEENIVTGTSAMYRPATAGTGLSIA